MKVIIIINRNCTVAAGGGGGGVCFQQHPVPRRGSACGEHGPVIEPVSQSQGRT